MLSNGTTLYDEMTIIRRVKMSLGQERKTSRKQGTWREGRKEGANISTFTAK